MSKLNWQRDIKDYLVITLGIMMYAMGWAAFLLPYQITTGGLMGIASIIYYSVGIEIQVTYFLLNAVLIGFALRILGLKFCIKTMYGIVVLTFFLWLFQVLMRDANGELPKLMGEGQEFMACVFGGGITGFGVGLIFCSNGSTGGTDIIAWIVNKYRNVTLGRIMMYCDIIIILSCYLIFQDWKRVLFGFTVLFIMSFVLDFVVNRQRQSVQFLIFSKNYEAIADGVSSRLDRGVTLLDGIGWYTKQPTKVIVVVAKRRESVDLFRLVKDIDPNAFISQSNVVGVYGEGFDVLKVK